VGKQHIQCICIVFSARQHICRARYMLSPVRLSVSLSVRHVGGSDKTVKVRIMQLSLQSSPVPLVFAISV